MSAGKGLHRDSVYIYTGPGYEYSMTGKTTGNGAFTIVEVENGWGKLKSGAGWVDLSMVEIVQ